jgi:hypothetical protein
MNLGTASLNFLLLHPSGIAIQLPSRPVWKQVDDHSGDNGEKDRL